MRLFRGDPTAETRYDDDPVARARAFMQAGAERLHVIDLDSAFGSGENLRALSEICAAVDVPVQTGGGIRSHEDAEARFAAGATDVILGTVIVERPKLAREIAEAYSGRVIGGVDARGARVAVRGWLEEGGSDRDVLVRELASWGLGRIVFTEIARDGTGEGYDVAALAHVASLSSLRITASGGARTLEDLRALASGTPSNVDAAILGRALYERTIDLEEALSFAREETQRRIGGARAASARMKM